MLENFVSNKHDQKRWDGFRPDSTQTYSSIPQVSTTTQKCIMGRCDDSWIIKMNYIPYFSIESGYANVTTKFHKIGNDKIQSLKGAKSNSKTDGNFFWQRNVSPPRKRLFCRIITRITKYSLCGHLDPTFLTKHAFCMIS